VKKVKGTTLRVSLVAGAALILALLVAGVALAQSTSFRMVRSSGAVTAGCLNPKAHANVTINSLGPVEKMTVTLSHMPKNREFDLFVTQVPDAPFGVSWYQGDIETNDQGQGTGVFRGRFSVETFAVAPGVAVAPQPHGNLDASSNPAFAKPVHTFHLGLWFNSPNAAAAAGCPNTTTPFNGDHTAGVQALSTRNFGDLNGPLRQIN
jgi:hypothetical protein